MPFPFTISPTLLTLSIPTLIFNWPRISRTETNTLIWKRDHILIVKRLNICIIRVHRTNTDNIHHSNEITITFFYKRSDWVIILATFWSLCWYFLICSYVILNVKGDNWSSLVYHARLMFVMLSRNKKIIFKNWSIVLIRWNMKFPMIGGRRMAPTPPKYISFTLSLLPFTLISSHVPRQSITTNTKMVQL